MSIGWTILHVLLNFYDASFLTFNVGDHLEARAPHKPYYKILAVAVIGLFFNLFNYLTDFSLASMYAFPIIFSIYLFAFLEGEWHKKAFWLLFVWTLLVSCDLLGSLLPMALHDVTLGFVLQNNSSRIVAILICRVMSTSLWIYLHKEKLKFDISTNGTLKILILLCFLIASTAVIGTNSKYETLDTSLLPTTLVLIFFTILAFFISATAREKQWENLIANEESVMAQKQSEMMKSYQYEVIKVYKAVRKFQLDIMEMIQSTWPTNGGKSTSDYFRSINDLTSALKNDFDTGDQLVDTVLSIKSSEAFHYGIALEPYGTLDADNMPIASDDICIILDCILSEAIHNVNLVQDEEASKSISVLFSGFQHSLQIKVEYPADGQAKTESKNLIGQIASQYNGSVLYTIRDFYCDMEVNLMYPDFVTQNIILAKGGVMQ